MLGVTKLQNATFRQGFFVFIRHLCNPRHSTASEMITESCQLICSSDRKARWDIESLAEVRQKLALLKHGLMMPSIGIKVSLHITKPQKKHKHSTQK